MTKDTRDTFRSMVQADDATWLRGRSWAFHLGVVAYPYYRERHPSFARIAKRAIDEVLSEARAERIK